MKRKQKLYYPSFEFVVVSQKEEIELITEILNDAIKNNSQFSYELYEKYPSLINAIDTKMNSSEMERAVSNSVITDYTKNLLGIYKSIKKFKAHWSIVEHKLLKRLMLDMNISFKPNSTIIVKVGNAPLCPRWISEMTFYVPSYIEEFDLVALHECCHFVFFSKYESLYGRTKKDEYEYPSNLWLLSEILIDSILNKKFYTNIIGKEIKAYDYLYDVTINDKNLVENITNIVIKCKNPETYIPKCMKFLESIENLI